MLHNRIYRSEELQSKSLTESRVHKVHGGEGADPCLELRRLDGRQVIGHDDRIQLETGADRQWIIEYDFDSTEMPTAVQVTADHRHDNLRDAGVQMVGLNDEGWPELNRV